MPPTVQERVTGVKQSQKAVREGRARLVYLACDADPAMLQSLTEQCAAAGVPVDRTYTMLRLGRLCGITVGASAAAVLRSR